MYKVVGAPRREGSCSEMGETISPATVAVREGSLEDVIAFQDQKTEQELVNKEEKVNGNQTE